MSEIKKTQKLSISQSLKCGIASLTSTCISVSLLHPLQVVKVRFQSHDGQGNEQNIVPKYRGVFSAIKQIVADQGYLALYKGLSVTVVNAAISSFLFFTFYQKRKKTLLQQGNPQRQHEMYEVLAASIQSGIAVICITQPMWVLRTRMLLNTKSNIKQSSNLTSTIKQIKDQHGLKGFYKGFSMNLLLTSNRALQMLAYQGSKQLYDRIGIPQSVLMERNFICGGIAKIANVFVIYPMTTLRTRIIQNQFLKAKPNCPKYNNVLEIVAKTLKRQGIQGFYKGMTANLLRGIPQRSIFFYSYQILKGYLLPQQQKH